MNNYVLLRMHHAQSVSVCAFELLDLHRNSENDSIQGSHLSILNKVNLVTSITIKYSLAIIEIYT